MFPKHTWGDFSLQVSSRRKKAHTHTSKSHIDLN